MLHITLGERRPVDPAVDELGRDHVGYAEGMSQLDLYTANRGCWVLGGRADGERYALFSFGGRVRLAMRVEGVEATSSNRRALVGEVSAAGDPLFEAYVGGPSPVQGVRNPVTYIPDPAFDLRRCACGCGESIVRGDWVPGHDQQALHSRVARIGTVKQFVEWFDDNAPQVGAIR